MVVIGEKHLAPLWRVPSLHRSPYIDAPFTFDDWDKYRTPLYRHWPEVGVLAQVLAGLWPLLLYVLVLAVAICIFGAVLAPHFGWPELNMRGMDVVLGALTVCLSLLLVFRVSVLKKIVWGENRERC
jgi:hypothetical protein